MGASDAEGRANPPRADDSLHGWMGQLVHPKDAIRRYDSGESRMVRNRRRIRIANKALQGRPVLTIAIVPTLTLALTSPVGWREGKRSSP
jgi:hypothetical protein